MNTPSTSEEAGRWKEFEIKLEELSDAEGNGHASQGPSPPPTRTSSRRRNPVKRFEFGELAEVKTEEYNDVKQDFGYDKEQGMEENEHDDEVNMEELEQDVKEFRDNLPYVEYHDGLQWQFMVDRINEGHDPLNYGSQLWRHFRDHYKNQSLIWNKALLSYISRCRRVLLPNLQIMPFDMEAKAALYQSLEYPVPKEFREELITATGIELSPSGYVEEYANRLPEIILQSHPPYKSSIGLTSTTTYSTLREPEGWHQIPEDDRTPWSDLEDRQILEWVRAQAVDPETGRLTKILVPRKMTEAMEYWKKYREKHKTDRGLRTLVTRFKYLREDLINSTAIDTRMKLELYYILSKPVDVEAGEMFKAFSILVIDEVARIRFALAVDYLLGRTDGELIDEDQYSFFYDIRMLRKLVGRSKVFDKNDPDEQIEIGRQIMKTIGQREWHEQQAMGACSNSTKFPYCGPAKQLPKTLKRSNQQSAHSSYLQSPKRQVNVFETISGIDFDKDVQQGPSSSMASNPAVKLSDAMKTVEMSISVVKMHIARFHAELRTASVTMTDERRLQCLTEIEQLTRMFRLSGKHALTPPEPPKPAKPLKQPKENKTN
ncbi:unnamed protein product [Caenorhabditis brenneri]